MDSIRDQISGGLTDGLAPVTENFLNTLARLIGISKDNPLLMQLSGKTVVIVTEKFGKISITIPDLNKPNA